MVENKTGGIFINMDNNILPEVVLTSEEKVSYLNSMIGRIYKVLHLIEEEGETGYSPTAYIAGIMFELNAADFLYENKFVTMIIKLEGIRKQYREMEFKDIKKQIFEIKRILKSMIREITGV